jgi:transposase
VLSRGDPADAEWAVLEPLLPRSNNRCGRWRNHRQVINGIIHRLSTGCQWRQPPARFGPWQTVHKRHMLGSADGTWERLIQHAQAIADEAGHTDRNINVDSTSIRAHQHAAGAPANPPSAPPGASKGALERLVHMRAHMPRPWRKRRRRRSPRPFSRRPDHEDPSKCGRQMPPPLLGPHARTTRGLVRWSGCAGSRSASVPAVSG